MLKIKKRRKYQLYIVSMLFFMMSFSGMIYYGYKAFYIEKTLASDEPYKKHFVLIAEEFDHEYWRLIEDGASEAALEEGVYLEYLGPRKADNQQILKLLDRMISVQVDGIIVQGIGGKRFIDLVFKGMERGIPIVTIDADVKNSARKAYIGSDNFYAGQLVGEAIIENTIGEQYVGIVTGRYDAINQQERIEGFKQAIASTDRIQIVGVETSNITQIGATRATYSLLKEHPSINVLVGMSSLDAVGMVEGLQEIAPNKDVYLTGFDLLPNTMRQIRNGKIDATIAQYPEEMGYEAIQVLLELQERNLLDHERFTKTEIITKTAANRLRRGGLQ